MNKRTAGIGCLTIFALPFAAVGVGALYWAASTLVEHGEIQSWVETPAAIKHAELKRNRGDDGDTFKAIAVYEYDFGGRHFTGNRVSIYTGSDNIGTFQQDAHRELKRHLDQGRPFRCYVDPDNPARAVLYRRLRWEMLLFTTMFATLFGSAGLGMLTAGYSAHRAKDEPTGDDAPPNQPWLVRRDWAAGQVESTAAASTTSRTMTVVTVWWNIAALPLVVMLPEIFRTASLYWALLTLIIPAIGAALVFAMLYRATRARKYGNSVLQLASVPGVVGGQLAGVINIPKVVHPDDGFHLKLSCVTWVTDSDGDSTEKTLWQDERRVAEPLAGSAPSETAVPVLFVIPFDATATTPPDTEPRVEWRLEVWAAVPGVDYKARFVVPVLRTAESCADFEPDESLATEFAPPPDADQLLAEAGIVKLPVAGRGIRLEFTAARNRTSAVIVTAVCCGWTGLVWFLAHSDAPIIFPIVFGLFDLPLVYATLDLWFHRSIAEASPAGLTTRGGILGLGRTHTYPADQIRRFGTEQYMSSGTHVWKSITIVPREGKARTIAKAIASRLVERAVINELNAALGKVEE